MDPLIGPTVEFFPVRIQMRKLRSGSMKEVDRERSDCDIKRSYYVYSWLAKTAFPKTMIRVFRAHGWSGVLFERLVCYLVTMRHAAAAVNGEVWSIVITVFEKRLIVVLPREQV